MIIFSQNTEHNDTVVWGARERKAWESKKQSWIECWIYGRLKRQCHDKSSSIEPSETVLGPNNELLLVLQCSEKRYDLTKKWPNVKSVSSSALDCM